MTNRSVKHTRSGVLANIFAISRDLFTEKEQVSLFMLFYPISPILNGVSRVITRFTLHIILDFI